MSERGGEKAGEKSFFARTAKITSKRAKRAQEKVKRKLGKSDETKDEIFDRFVDNFNKQQDAVQRLQKELKNYVSCITAMLNANQLFSEAVKQVYEPDWSGRNEFADLLDSVELYWDNLVQKLQNEVLEPLTSYQAQFPDTKNRISKRSRKVVDYDRYRHHLETLKIKGGKAGEPKKLSQVEEDYNQAKSVYLQIHSDLYEELPALYDSRISFYVSLFQSIFTAEGVFHQETSKIKTQMNDLLDVLAKETSAGTYSTRRPLSVVSNASSEGENSPFENYSKYEQADNSAQSESEEVDASDVKFAEQPITEVDGGDPDGTELEVTEAFCEDRDETSSDNSSPEVEENNSSHPLRPPPAVPKRPVERPPSPNTVDIEPQEELEKIADIDINGPPETGEDEKNLPKDTGLEEGSEEEKVPGEEPISHLLYKVVATHPYTGEDEDELTFEKGEVINVVKYDESDDPDDGWLLGMIESTGMQGVFPENFTKKLSDDKPS